ncbi:hypothetical protein R8Z57_08480 [Microbacterium sp. M3]|uniref:Aminobenzoate synthetase n=1 Tax=Microbacterium arthrosphaerae TaxID=792652 RepID=A0ABU4H0E3_9MICO|nr:MULTISPECIES: hypothetical protein [Microbacterium]MDW4572806.1 hypothetical protein [Microbacterium arthrosphaerae]MDW7606661.1 hypothetical protein [Microbacterium sp. M3]
MSSAPSRSSQDAVGSSLAQAVAQIAAAVAGVAASNPVVLIDGRSGAGKSSVARALVARWPLRGRVQLVALDSIYPGWDGLEAGVEIVRESILIPHARGVIGVWQRWDWTVGASAEAHAVDPSLPLIVEGSGLLTDATARLGDVRVWLESPPSSRKERALTRDGDTYRPHWERWARQEQRHVERDDPVDRATHVFRVP